MRKTFYVGMWGRLVGCCLNYIIMKACMGQQVGDVMLYCDSYGMIER